MKSRKNWTLETFRGCPEIQENSDDRKIRGYRGASEKHEIHEKQDIYQNHVEIHQHHIELIVKFIKIFKKSWVPGSPGKHEIQEKQDIREIRGYTEIRNPHSIRAV